MTEISATDAARRFSDLLDSVEHEGEDFTVIRHGKAVAHIEPISSGSGTEVKSLLRRHRLDVSWATDHAAMQELLEVEDRA